MWKNSTNSYPTVSPLVCNIHVTQHNERRTTPVTGVALRIDIAPFCFLGGTKERAEEKLHSQTDPDMINTKSGGANKTVHTEQRERAVKTDKKGSKNCSPDKKLVEK